MTRDHNRKTNNLSKLNIEGDQVGLCSGTLINIEK